MKILLLGTGTSHGIPVIGCDCDVCMSKDPRDRRYRCSAYIKTNNGKCILVDVGPEFRLQAVENRIKQVDMVLLTHSHADHLHGLDDLRIFSCDMWKVPDNPEALKKYNAPAIPIYTNANTLKDVQNRFGYFFKPVKEGGGHARVELKEAKSPFKIDNVTITPIPMMHGHLQTVGWLFTEENEVDGKIVRKSAAYLTDCNYISDDAINLIKNTAGELEHVVIDGLRIKPHSTHFNIMEAMAVAEKMNPENVWITHLTHLSSHTGYEEYINKQKSMFPGLKNVAPAFDRQELEI